MGLRGSFAGGVTFGVVAVAVAAAVLPVSRADDRTRDVRLLVSCDEGTRPKVLDALRGLDVVVHDLATMQRVPIENTPVATSPAPLANALEVWTESAAIFDSVRKAAGPEKSLTVNKFSVGPASVYVSGGVSDAATFDALESALRSSERLGRPRVERGSLSRNNAQGWFRFDLSFPTPPAARVPETPKGSEEPTARTIINAVQRAGASVRAMGAVEIATSPTGERRSVTVQVEAADLETFGRALREVAAIPGLLVVAAATSVSDGRTFSFKVTVTVPR